MQYTIKQDVTEASISIVNSHLYPRNWPSTIWNKHAEWQTCSQQHNFNIELNISSTSTAVMHILLGSIPCHTAVL